MAKCRMVDTRFWDDAYIASLSPIEKLLFLYLITNPLTTIAGVYEVEAPWLAVVNFVKHQSLNPKVVRGITIALQSAPRHMVEKLQLPGRIHIALCGELPVPRRKGSGVKSFAELIKA